MVIDQKGILEPQEPCPCYTPGPLTKSLLLSSSRCYFSQPITIYLFKHCSRIWGTIYFAWQYIVWQGVVWQCVRWHTKTMAFTGTYFVSESPPWAAPEIRITSKVLEKWKKSVSTWRCCLFPSNEGKKASEGVPGIKSQVISNKLLDSPSYLLCTVIDQRGDFILYPYFSHPFN